MFKVRPDTPEKALMQFIIFVLSIFNEDSCITCELTAFHFLMETLRVVPTKV